MRILGRCIAVGLAAALPVAVLGGLVLALTVGHHVDRGSLSYSVGSRLGGFASCRRRPTAVWRCVASPEQAPDVGPWTVRVTGHCWHARLDTSAPDARGRSTFAGCISVWDQLRLHDIWSFKVHLKGYY